MTRASWSAKQIHGIHNGYCIKSYSNCEFHFGQGRSRLENICGILFRGQLHHKNMNTYEYKGISATGLLDNHLCCTTSLAFRIRTKRIQAHSNTSDQSLEHFPSTWRLLWNQSAAKRQGSGAIFVLKMRLHKERYQPLHAEKGSTLEILWEILHFGSREDWWERRRLLHLGSPPLSSCPMLIGKSATLLPETTCSMMFHVSSYKLGWCGALQVPTTICQWWPCSEGILPNKKNVFSQRCDSGSQIRSFHGVQNDARPVSRAGARRSSQLGWNADGLGRQSTCLRARGAEELHISLAVLPPLCFRKTTQFVKRLLHS